MNKKAQKPMEEKAGRSRKEDNVSTKPDTLEGQEEEKKKKSPLSQAAWEARQAGMSYGKYVGLRHQEDTRRKGKKE